jgi:hypothetical protein
LTHFQPSDYPMRQNQRPRRCVDWSNASRACRRRSARFSGACSVL